MDFCSCHIIAPCSFCVETCPCGSGNKEIYFCEKCEETICEKCDAHRTSTNNVESNICTGCADNTNHFE